MEPGIIDDTTDDKAANSASSKTAQIIAEARQRIQNQSQQEIPDKHRQLAERLNRIVYWLAKHWLALFNAMVGFYVGGAIAAPIFARLGLNSLANLLYRFYQPFCHQYPFRSWFLFGAQHSYPLTQPLSVIEMNNMRSFVGNSEVGYKMAFCQRDICIYGCLFLGGLIYGYLRDRRKIDPLPMWQYFIFGVLPMLFDGGVQWLSYLIWALFPTLIDTPFETIALMRALTGSLFGAGIVAATYPHLQEYFSDVHTELQRKFNWR